MALTANINRASSSPVIAPSEFNPYAQDRNSEPAPDEDAIAHLKNTLSRGKISGL